MANSKRRSRVSKLFVNAPWPRILSAAAVSCGLIVGVWAIAHFHLLGRGHADAPDIDCLVRVKGKGVRPGDLVSVKVTAADAYDLVGRAVGPAR